MDDPPLIDSHAHVWDRNCAFVPGARYHPNYEATIDHYLKVLDSNAVEKAVLVQPSFLGANNDYLLACLKRFPDRLRGIVVVDQSASPDQLDEMTAAGVIGLRYNLIGGDIGTLASEATRKLTRKATDRGWWIEVQAEGPDWPFVLETLLADGARIMVDHFGKPSSPDCPGHAALLATDPSRHVVKLSAPYRQAPDNMAPYAQAFLANWGAAHCLWGSDWPWTQHEARHVYRDCQQWLSNWAITEDRADMACAAPALCRF